MNIGTDLDNNKKKAWGGGQYKLRHILKHCFINGSGELYLHLYWINLNLDEKHQV